MGRAAISIISLSIFSIPPSSFICSSLLCSSACFGIYTVNNNIKHQLQKLKIALKRNKSSFCDYISKDENVETEFSQVRLDKITLHFISQNFPLTRGKGKKPLPVLSLIFFWLATLCWVKGKMTQVKGDLNHFIVITLFALRPSFSRWTLVIKQTIHE